MGIGEPLNWSVPASSWERLESRIEDRYGRTRGYAGFELTKIADHWLLVEEIDDELLDLSNSATPHTQKTNESETPLENEEKVTVSHRIHPETKEQLSIAASRYDVNHGVLLGYIIREYYETDGWGYSLEALEDIANGARPEPEATERAPQTRAEKLDVICDRVSALEREEIRYDEIAEVITDVAGSTVVDGKNGYLSDVLDRLDYVQHPRIEDFYCTIDRLEQQWDLTPDDPACDRKPVSTLTKQERIQAIKLHILRTGRGVTKKDIQTDVLDGEGSATYVRNLIDEIASTSGFDYSNTLGGQKVLTASHETRKAYRESVAEGEVMN